jgi:hypothetical protein
MTKHKKYKKASGETVPARPRYSPRPTSPAHRTGTSLFPSHADSGPYPSSPTSSRISRLRHTRRRGSLPTNSSYFGHQGMPCQRLYNVPRLPLSPHNFFPSLSRQAAHARDLHLIDLTAADGNSGELRLTKASQQVSILLILSCASP